MDGALQPRLVLIGLAVHIVLGAAVDYDGMCAAGTFSPEAAYQAACHKPENISDADFKIACENATQLDGASLLGKVVAGDDSELLPYLERNVVHCDLKSLKVEAAAYFSSFENQCTNFVKGKYMMAACSEIWKSSQPKWKSNADQGNGTLESNCGNWAPQASQKCCGVADNDEAFDCNVAGGFDPDATSTSTSTLTTPTTTPVPVETTTNATDAPTDSNTTTSTTPTTTPQETEGGDNGDGGGGGKTGASSLYEAMWAGLCIDATKPESANQFSLNYDQCASKCADESAKAALLDSVGAAGPGCRGFAHHGLADMCLIYPDDKGQFSVFTKTAECVEDGCGMTYTGWRCYGEPGTARNGPAGKACPASDGDSRAATAANDVRLQTIWSPESKDCIDVPNNSNECFAEGLSWWTEQSMCVAPCREGQFANPENGACIAVSGSIVCGDDTEYNARTGECTATDTPTPAPDQTTENEVSSNFCGEGTQYNTDEDTCVVTAESLLASSAMATIAVGPFTIPLWGLIAMAALLFCVLLTAIVGCCCCCGCCECSSVESGGDEGYRKYLPDSYTNPAWRQSYAAGSQA